MIKVYNFNNEILNNKFFSKNKKESYVFFIHCTKDYYEYFFTTVFSILKNTNQNIEIISFFADYDEEKFLYFKNKIKKFDERIDFHIFKIEKNVLSEKWIIKNFIDRYSRFLMFHKYFHSLQNAIYMDCDIVVNSDVYLKMKEIEFNMKNDCKNNFAIFCVRDILLHLESCFFDFSFNSSICKHSSFDDISLGNLHVYEYIKKYLKINPNDYFNFGFFYISNFKSFNLDEIKKIIEKDFAILDQDIGNLLFNKKVYYLDENFNFPVLGYEYLKNFLTKEKKSYYESFIYQSLQNCKITNEFIKKHLSFPFLSKDFSSIDLIHYSGGMCGEKPWNARNINDKDYINIWKKYNELFFDKNNHSKSSKRINFFKKFCRYLIKKIMSD